MSVKTNVLISASGTNMKTNKMKVCELTGAALDWAVAKCEGKIDNQEVPRIGSQLWCWEDGERMRYFPSDSWSQGGPIIERERINVSVYASLNWMATMNVEKRIESGPTPLIAAMRCYVASKMGDTVAVPPELA